MSEFNIVMSRFLIVLGGLSFIVAILMKLQIVKQGGIWGYSLRSPLLMGAGLLIWGFGWVLAENGANALNTLLQLCGMAFTFVGNVVGVRDKKRFKTLQQTESTSAQK